MPEPLAFVSAVAGVSGGMGAASAVGVGAAGVVGSLVGAVIGVAWGLIADRIAARWPAHEDGSVRAVDWRTAVVPVVGGVAMGAAGLRFAGDSAALALFGAYFLSLVLLLATDLDQRLLPDVVTLPWILVAIVAAATGWNPLVRGALVGAVVVAVLVPAILFALSIPFGAGAIGIGDLKLLVSVGLLAGLSRTLGGVMAGAILAGVVILALLAARRISLRSYIPFGPFLIVGALWGILLPS